MSTQADPGASLARRPSLRWCPPGRSHPPDVSLEPGSPEDGAEHWIASQAATELGGKLLELLGAARETEEYRTGVRGDFNLRASDEHSGPEED